LEEIKLKEGPIKSEDKDKDYMKAIINILKSKLGGGGNEEEGEENDDTSPDPKTPEGGRRRNLNDDEDDKEGEESSIPTDDIIAYGKHLLPVLIFIVVALLCIPGWLMCCFCCCCNCCCCCCCKKPCCKIPCFVITYGLYALVVAVCIYGISTSNHIFVGIADTECSILRFFDEILEGEIKTETPRWAGFEGIIDILEDMSYQIEEMKTSTQSDLNAEMTSINSQKTTFLNYMQEIWKRFTNDENIPPNNYISEYTKTYNDLSDTDKRGEYVLDLIKSFGYYHPTEKKYLPEGSTLDIWEREYKLVSDNADSNMKQAQDGFNDILSGNIKDITDPLEEGKNTISDIKESFNDIKGTIADIIVDNSETIDEYGKLGIKAVFGVLALINVAIAAFMLLLCLCSGKCCTKCCCCRCICKLFTHLLWNILALLMIIVFLVGSLFALIGKIGSDAMSVISYVVSEDNIGANGDGVLVDQLEENKKYVSRCIGGDGKIIEEMGLDLSQINSINNISDTENQIKDAKREFNDKKENLYAYNLYLNKLNQRVDLTDEELSLLRISDNNALNFKYLLEKMNEKTLSSHKEKWQVEDSDTTKECGSGADEIAESHPDTIIFHPNKCNPSDRDWINGADVDPVVKENSGIISDILGMIKEANKDSDTKYYRKTLTDLKEQYELYLGKYLHALDTFNTTINKITGKLNKYTGGSETFSFVNCNFIGTNLKIILKYLKEVFGGDIYTIGVCLILVGCSLALSISFTILLIVVINANIDANKSKNKI
jgi:hypothetical protein